MASGHAAPIEVRLGRSARLLFLLIALHAAGVAALAASALPAWLRLAPLPLLLWSCVHHARMHALRSVPDAIVALRLGADGALAAALRGGGWVAVSALPGSAILGFVVVLRAGGPARGRRTLVVTSDALAPGQWRALRLWLRWRAALSLGAGAD
jgi:hypothetical protein